MLSLFWSFHHFFQWIEPSGHRLPGRPPHHLPSPPSFQTHRHRHLYSSNKGSDFSTKYSFAFRTVFSCQFDHIPLFRAWAWKAGGQPVCKSGQHVCEKWVQHTSLRVHGVRACTGVWKLRYIKYVCLQNVLWEPVWASGCIYIYIYVCVHSSHICECNENVHMYMRTWVCVYACVYAYLWQNHIHPNLYVCELLQVCVYLHV